MNLSARGSHDIPVNEMERMRQQLEQQQQVLAKVEREKAQLQKDLHASKEQRAVLEATVKSHKEDFEQERRDRERAQSRFNKVETELVALKRQQHQNSIQQMQDYSQRRKAALEFHKEEFYRKNPHAPEHLELVADCEDELDSGIGMMRSLSDEGDYIPGMYTTKSAHGSTGRSNGHISYTGRSECDGYDDIDGGCAAGRVVEEEGGLEEDPNGAFQCDDCKRRFGATGYVAHVMTCTGT